MDRIYTLVGGSHKSCTILKLGQKRHSDYPHFLIGKNRYRF